MGIAENDTLELVFSYKKTHFRRLKDSFHSPKGARFESVRVLCGLIQLVGMNFFVVGSPGLNIK